MKKALIIIGAVFAGLILLAVVGSLLPNDEPAPEPAAVTQPATAEATPAVMEEEAGLTAAEQEVYDYISGHVADVESVFDDFSDAAGDFDLDAMVDASREWRKLSDEWDELPVAGGQVEDLEYAFDGAVYSLQKVMNDAVKMLDGKTVSDATLERHITATVESIAECEDELEALAELATY